MRKSTFQNALGLFLIVAHFGVLLTVVALWLRGGFTFEEMTTTVALIAPMFVTYTTAIVRHIVKNMAVMVAGFERVNRVFVSVALLIPTLFVTALVTCICLKALNLAFASFEQFKNTLVAIESTFGVYIGIVLSSLFETMAGATDAPPASPPLASTAS